MPRRPDAPQLPVDLAGDIIFMMDILINFNTAYVRSLDAVLVTDRAAIRSNYLTGEPIAHTHYTTRFVHHHCLSILPNRCLPVARMSS